MRIGIDVQHIGKPDRNDLGASQPPGYSDPLIHEVDITMRVGANLALLLSHAGHFPFLTAMGQYSTRAQNFNTLKCDLVLMLHMNALPDTFIENKLISIQDKASHGIVFYDYRTANTNIERAEKFCSHYNNNNNNNNVIDKFITNKAMEGSNAMNCMTFHKGFVWLLELGFIDSVRFCDKSKVASVDDIAKDIAEGIFNALVKAYES